MLEYKKFMDTYKGDNMEEVISPKLRIEWESKHVLVTHDKCTFYSNDTKASMWMEDGESITKKKGQGG